jgi:lactoylglutathione lyase
MAKMIHSMIRVIDEDRSRAFYEKALGLELANRYEFDGFTLIYLSNPETAFELELTVNKGHSENYDLGNGYGHLAVSVENIEAEHARLADLGLSPTDTKSLSHNGDTLATYFFVTDPDGYKIEFLKRAGRYL